jgi:thiamine-monophosphate kinase
MHKGWFIGNFELMAMSKDLFMEGVHFLRDNSQAWDVGYKSLAVNVSDLASKGATPQCYLLGLSLPKDLPFSWLKEFLDGVHECAEKWGLTLAGGDTTSSDGPIGISITIWGTLEESRLKLRADAQVGDAIVVTGFLGDSAAGLDLVLRDKEAPGSEYFKFRHFRPIPQVKEGEWLSGQEAVHATMDLSDGLLLDLPKICKASNCGAEIDVSLLPISPAMLEGSGYLGWDATQWALTGGEDYVLLATLEASKAESVIEAFNKNFAVPMTKIGEITSIIDQIDWKLRGVPYKIEKKPFEHFRP